VGSRLRVQAWRERWPGKTREECEELIAFMLANRSPWCASIARRELEREDREEG
jgi:hypothetical protein